MKQFNLTLLALFLCFASFAAVAPITGSDHVCRSGTIMLADATTGGTWSSSTPAVASVGFSSGVVSGVAAGTATITYTVGASFVTMAVTVNALPAVYTVSGGMYCAGGAGGTIYTDGSETGVNYQLYHSGVPTGSPTAGTGSSLSWGPFIITGSYTVIATNASTGCTRNMTGSGSVVASPLPTPYTLYFPGSGSFCSAGPDPHLYLSGSQMGGYTYQLYKNGLPTTIAIPGTGSTLDFGAVAVSSGDSFFVSISNDITGCVNSSGGITATVLPSPGGIIGVSSVCVGSSITLTDTTAGGTWSSSNTAIGTISAGGVVTGIATGTTTITYIAPSGCSATRSITVINLVLPIAGPSIACTGSTLTLTDPTGGGMWTSSNTAAATVGTTSGIVTGVSTGTTTISYTVGGSCGYVSKTVTVHSTPAAITGITSVCAGGTTSLSDATPGGTWSSSNTAVATVGSSGVVTTVAGGAAVIGYTAAGCGTTVLLSVDPPPMIGGPTTVCVAATITLTTSIAGSWSSSNPFVASVSSTGVVTGTGPGTAVITCNSFSTGCVSTRTITVTSSCSGTPAAGVAHAAYTSLCGGNADLLYLSGASSACGVGFQWQYSADSIWWTDIAGAMNDSFIASPGDAIYYRCKVTCYGSGLFAYSAGVHVVTYNTISGHNVIENPSYFCNGPAYQLTTCGAETNSNVITYYGDGTHDSTHLAGTGVTPAHAYSMAGTYTVKQVLRNGVAPQDSVTFSYTYNYCRTLPVSFYFDANGNCVFDGGDGFMYHPITTAVDSNGITIDTITAVNGFYYRALGDAGTIYRFRVIGYDTGLHLACPTTGIVYDTITAYMNTYGTKYIGFTCPGTSSSYDLSVSGHINCGRHEATGNIYVGNSYCTAVSAVVTMTFSPHYVFTSAYPAPFSVAGNTVTWHLSPLTAYTATDWTPNISYTLTVPGPFLTAGDTVQTTYHVTPTSGDVNAANNTYLTIDTIRASFDPNYIRLNPEGVVIPCTPLQYSIHFENVGNDTAHNIAVIDTLPDNLDIHTLKVLSATAVVNLVKSSYSGHNVVKFDFPHINLADSSHHNLCKGAVTFSIKTKAGLADGTVVRNYASIYFDDNLPVKTDTTSNTTGISPIAGPTQVCMGASVLLTDASVNGAWSSTNATATVASGYVNGITPGTDTIKYTLTNSCGTKTATKAVTINPLVMPGVSTHSSTGMGDTVCVGSIPTFTAAAVNGGPSPAYAWQVNGVAAGTGSTLTYVPLPGDVVRIKVTSNAQCVTPDTATAVMALELLTPVSPIDSMTATPGVMIAPGMADTFVAYITSGGPATYEWLINGVATGDTGDTFITHTLADKDSVTCITTATDLCRLSSFNSLIVTVSTVATPIVARIGGMNIYPNPNKAHL